MNNVEKLRNYFLGKDPQLKETMADNSLRLIGIEGKHFVLRTELLARLKKLRDELTEADEQLQRNIDAVVHDLELETQARQNADTALNNRFANYYTKSDLDARIPFHSVSHDLVIVPGNPTIDGVPETGWYYTGNYKMWWGDVGEDVVANENTLFYFYKDENNDNWIWINPATAADSRCAICDSLYYDNTFEHEWTYNGYQISDIFNTEEFANHTVPTTAGVIGFFSENVGKVSSVNLAYNSDSTAMDDGIGKVFYLNFKESGMDYYNVHSLAYIESWAENGHLIHCVQQRLNSSGFAEKFDILYNSTSHEWEYRPLATLYTTPSTTGILGSSTDAEYPTSKAVYDFVTSHGGTGDIPQFDLRYDDVQTLFDDYTGKVVEITSFVYDNSETVTLNANGLYYVEPTPTSGSYCTLTGLLTKQHPGPSGDGAPHCNVLGYITSLQQWSLGDATLMGTTTSVTSTPKDYRYPTEKAVYDFVKALADANGLTMP